ncbi:MAG: hypothetical protein HAW58_01165 [Candidatus Thioglobus sp.]|nr:hypothetical protein [Candidatus Thioglobus sp.]
MKKLLLTIFVTLFALSTQADLVAVEHEHNWNSPTGNSNSNSGGSYKSAVKAAKAEQKKAKKLGFEWRDIGKFLKTANKKYKAGDVKGAMKLVAKAKTQAILGQRQARDQANAGPTRF